MKHKLLVGSLFGIIGNPVKHSASPVMHNAAFNELDIDAEYVTIRVEPKDMDDTICAVTISGFGGINVTVPYKKEILKYVKTLTDEAKLCGSVNTVRIERDGTLTGTSTDGDGLIKSLKEEKIRLANKTVLLVGAGGAASSVALSLIKQKGINLYVTNRTESEGKKLVRKLSKYGEAHFTKLRDDLLDKPKEKIDILINCTSVGLNSKDKFVFDLSSIKNVPVVVDLIYNPSKTYLLTRAAKAGCRTINGKGMLLHQGALAFKFWTGRKAPLEVMRAALDEFLAKPVRKSSKK